MGRKIPAKKHRGVKDPLQQQARRNQILKTKINAPPKDPDEQPIPRSLTELFSSRDRAAARKPKPKPAANNTNTVKGKGNPISGLRKLPGESGRGFSLRINSAIRALHDSEEPQDYPQDLEEEDGRGARMVALRERRQRRTRRAADAADAAHAARAPRRRAARRQDKLRAAAEAAEQARRERPQYERVPFGERCHAPPALSAPRAAPPRAGPRDLLLSRLLPAPPPAPPPAAAAAARERARLAAVAAYRALKKTRLKH